MTRWDADARYTDFVRRRSHELLRFAILLTGSRADGEDALQEAVVAVARSWSRLLVHANEAVAFSYLRTALIRKTVDGHRRAPRLAEEADRPVEEPGFLRVDADRRFFAMVADLPQQQRAVLVLRYYLDLDDARIAVLLGIGRATVRSNAMRGLDKLRAAERVEDL